MKNTMKKLLALLMTLLLSLSIIVQAEEYTEGEASADAAIEEMPEETGEATAEENGEAAETAPGEDPEAPEETSPETAEAEGAGGASAEAPEDLTAPEILAESVDTVVAEAAEAALGGVEEVEEDLSVADSVEAVEGILHEAISVTYVDENGDTHTASATPLANDMTSLDPGWYVAKGKISMSSEGTGLSFSGNTSLILADGCELTVTSNKRTGVSAGGTLTIYGQSGQSGRLTAEGPIYGISAVNSLNIYGGVVQATSQYGLTCENINISTCGKVEATGTGDGSFGIYCYTISISCGAVTANGKRYGIYSDGNLQISGGKVSATATGTDDEPCGIISSDGNINLGFTNATDSIYASSYNTPKAGKRVIVANGQTMTDGTNDYAGELDSTKVSAIAGKTLIPANAKTIIVSDTANGTVKTPAKVFVGSTVTLTITPAAGYELGILTVKDEKGNSVKVSGNTFTMPDSNVTVAATFVKIKSESTTAPSTSPTSQSVVSPAPAPSGPTITIPKVPASVKAKAKKSKVTVSWNKIKKTKKTKALLAQIKGIELQYSTDPTFAENVTTKTLGKKKTKVTLKLQKKTVYYIRVRYTDGAGGVSNWSKVKKVKTK